MPFPRSSKVLDLVQKVRSDLERDRCSKPKCMQPEGSEESISRFWVVIDTARLE